MAYRRGICRFFACLAAAWLVLLTGCEDSGPQPGKVEKVWGKRGTANGRFNKPRAITIDSHDNLYIVDMTARIQVFDRKGTYLRSWQTPASINGRPTGVSIDRQGRVMVADTHYFRVLFYTPEGKLLEEMTIGGTSGPGPGEFNFVTDVVQDSQGNYYIAEYGEYDRIQKFSSERKFLYQWGSHGSEPGQFMRPQGLALDEHDHLWVADACNHRIQVFDATGAEPKLIKQWGRQGNAPGELNYPYNLWLDGKGSIYIAEFGNHRVQKFSLDGEPQGTWGRNGAGEGEMYQPWGLVRDSKQRFHVLDTYNHRVQTFFFD